MPESGTTAPPASPVRRKDNEIPAAVTRLGWRCHHLGIPTDLPRPDEKPSPLQSPHLPIVEKEKRYLKSMGKWGDVLLGGGIEAIRFEETSLLPEIIRTVPHIAFAVDNLEVALKGREILFDTSAPSGGVRTAMILDAGAPAELMEFASLAEQPGR